MIRSLFILSFIISVFGYGQVLQLEDLHYRNAFSDSVFILNQKGHSSIKPFIRTCHVISNKAKGGYGRYWQSVPDDKDFLDGDVHKAFELYPIADIGLGIDNQTGYVYTAGLGFAASASGKKWHIETKFLPYSTKPGFVGDSIQNNRIDLGTGQSISFSEGAFFRGELMGVYRLNKFFTFLGGYGKNTFGEGYRSLLLSDHAAANPFLKIETNFHTVKHVNLFNVWNDFYGQNEYAEKRITKLSAMHYLSWNITSKFNLSLFETVVWQAKDSLTRRYFEPNYMNPFVFYRPVEYAQGSADNVLVGLNMSIKPNKKSVIYYQLVLDEFLLSELRAGDKWWGNKFGMQIGAKSIDLGIPNLYGQLEFNFVRPFTYSHKQSVQAYAHANSAVAHPLGANFYEINSIFSYKQKQHRFTNHIVYAGYGTDTAGFSFGQNVLASYSNRDGNYDHLMMQGQKHNVLSFILIYEYEIPQVKNMFLMAKYKLRSDKVSKTTYNNHFLEVGIRSRIWNRYDDI